MCMHLQVHMRVFKPYQALVPVQPGLMHSSCVIQSA